MQEMEPSGASAAISTSSYGGIHMPGIMNRASKSKTETSSSMETAYWSGRRKQLGLSRLDVEKESETTENEKYDQVGLLRVDEQQVCFYKLKQRLKLMECMCGNMYRCWCYVLGSVPVPIFLHCKVLLYFKYL